MDLLELFTAALSIDRIKITEVLRLSLDVGREDLVVAFRLLDDLADRVLVPLPPERLWVVVLVVQLCAGDGRAERRRWGAVGALVTVLALIAVGSFWAATRIDRARDLAEERGVEAQRRAAVAEAAVVARPDEKWGERPLLIAVPASERTPTKEAVLQYLSGTLAKWQLPDDVLFVDELPMTTTGKIDKKTIRAGLAEQGYTLPDLRD